MKGVKFFIDSDEPYQPEILARLDGPFLRAFSIQIAISIIQKMKKLDQLTIPRSIARYGKEWNDQRSGLILLLREGEFLYNFVKSACKNGFYLFTRDDKKIIICALVDLSELREKLPNIEDCFKGTALAEIPRTNWTDYTEEFLNLETHS